ncbi:MAG: hypothetical protein HZC01_02655 [Candidatus Kerfeldbacteria bacterium]|nr:hypothetical protein [Candidatus Kerfeldbacteria bacterium]
MFFLFKNISFWLIRPLKLLGGKFLASQEIHQTRITINFVEEQIRQTYFQIHRLGIIRVVGSVIGIIILQAIPVTSLMAIEAASNTNAVIETSMLSAEVFHLAQSDFAAGEDVPFSIEVAQKPILPIFNFGKVERVIDGMTLMTPSDDIELTLAANSTQANGRSAYEQYTIPHEYATAPGKYQLLVTTTEDGEQVTTERDFYWGVLVLNTDQDTYRPGDTAVFQMGAVDDVGVTVCDADMRLVVTAPDGQETTLTSAAGTIERSAECGPTTVTHAPDYRAVAPLTLTGTYQMALTAEYDGVTHTWDGTVDVTETAPFTIRRVGPSRIWPQAAYHMTLTVTPEADYQGMIREQVPGDFIITEVGEDGAYLEDEVTTSVEWQADWRAGETYHLSYTFDAPDISPALFTLGPLAIGNYQETRVWQIASDALAGTGILVYGEDGANSPSPRYRTWSGTDLGNEASAQADETVTVDVNHSIIECGTTRNECIRGDLNDAGHLDVQVWNGNTSAWGNGGSAPTNGDFTTGIGTTNDVYRAFDIAYEDTSGDGMVVYESSSTANGTIMYRTWDGTNWSAEQTLTYSGVSGYVAGVAFWVELEADYGSNNILLAFKDGTNNDVYAMRWDGTAWVNSGSDLYTLITAAGSITTKQDFDIAWEGTSGKGKIVYATGTTTGASTYTAGSGWAADSSPFNPALAVQWIRIAGSPNNNYIASMYNAVVSTTSADMYVDMWNGTDWTSVTTPAGDTDINNNGYAQPMDVAWEYGSSSDRALFVWRDGTTSELYVRYMVFDIAGHALGSNVFIAPDDDGAGTATCNLTGTASDDNVATGGLSAAENSNGPCSADVGMSWENEVSGIDLNADPSSRKIILLGEDLTLDLKPEVQLWNGTDAGTWLTQTANMSYELDLSTGATLSTSLPTKAYDFAFRRDDTVIISGTAYTSHTEGATLNSSGGAIKLVNSATGATNSDTDGTDGSGVWSIPNVPTPTNGNDLIIYIDGAATDGTLVLQYGASCTGTPSCTGLKLYQDAVVVRNEHTGLVTNQDLSGCDNDSGTNCADTEIGYTSNLSGTYNLTTSSGRELHIWTGDALDPGGTITTDATGGDVHVDDSATLDFDTATSTVGANLVIDASATANVIASTTVTGAAAGGVTVAGTLNQTSGTPTFTIGNGTDEDLTTNTGASVTLSSGTTVIKDDLVMNAGTVAVSDTMDHNDNTTGNIIDLNGGALTISGGTYTLGGDLEQDGGTATISTTFTLGGDLDVNTGTLDIDPSANVDFAGVFCTQVGAIVNLDGGTTDGTTASSSHFRFNGGTINLTGGTHQTASDAIVEFARNSGGVDCNSDGTLGNTTFNMSGGVMKSRAYLVYGSYTLTTTTVSGGTLQLGYGGTQASNILYNANSGSFQFYDVTVVASSSISSSQTYAFPIKNKFTINSAQDFNLNGEDLTVDGGWVNNGTMTTPSAGTVTLRGGQFTGSADSKFYNLTIDPSSPATVTIDTDVGADDPTVYAALTVAASDELAIEVNRTLLVDRTSGSVSLSGTISGAGRLTYQPAAAFPTGGTITSILRFDSEYNSQIMGARTYGGNVESYNNSVSTRTLTMGTAGGQTINVTGAFTVFDNFGGMTVTAATHDPTVNITGTFGPCTMVDGNPGFIADAGTWTASGDVNMTLCWGSSFTGSHTLLMDGSSKTLTSSLTSWQNFTATGTITLANANHTIKGNVVLTGSTITAGTSTINMTGTAHAITGAGQTLNNLTINPSSAGTITAQTSDFTVGGTLNVAVGDQFTINSGITVTHTGATLTLSGTMNGPGRLTYRSATAFPTTGTLASSLILKMDSTSTNQSMGQRTDYQKVEIDNSGTTAGRTVTVGTAGSQTITINSTLDLMNTGADPSTTVFQVNTWDPAFTVTGSVTIAANTTFEASSATTTNFGDDFSNSGTFTHNSGAIALTTTTAATIAGNTTFNNFSVTSIGAAKTINFTNGSTTTVSGTWTVTGAVGQLVTLQSTSLGNQWTINPTSASISYVDVNDSNNTGAAICATFSQSTSDNNTNWGVSAGATCGIDIAGTSNSSGGTVRVAVNTSLQAQTTTLAASWTITGVTVNNTDIVTVFVEGVDTAETTGVAQYDGTGNIGGMVLNTNVLSIGSDDNQTIDLADLDLFSCSDNENVMHSVAAGVLDIEGTDAGCGANPANSYSDETLKATASDPLSIGNSQTLNSHNVTIDASGSITSGTSGVFDVSGTWDNNGTFTASTSTVTFSSGSTETVEAGSSSFNNVVFANASGNWTVQTNNMTTNNLTLTSGTFTLESGRTLEVQGNYSQAIVAANTTWTGSTLYLNGSGGMYDINTKTHGGDTYATLRVGGSEDIAMWDSSAATAYTIDAGGCLFSEDHSGSAGRLNIYGTCNSRANEYWSYTTDFDGAAVTRQTDVRFAPSATLTVDNGDTLEILGQSAGANRSLVTRESTGNYGLTVSGTINAQYYDFDYLNASGLNLTSTATVTELSDGSFDNNASGASSSYLTLTSLTSSKSLFRIVFDESGDGTDSNVVYNINADGSGIDWTMLQWSGGKGGEANDNEVNSASVKWFSDLTLAVSANSIDLGVVNPLITGSGSHTITVTSNAPSGYTCRAAEDGNLRNGASDIDDVIDGAVTTGSEEYGISCTGADCQLSGDNALSGSPLTIATYNTTAVARVTTLYYKAAISSATAGLSYSHIVTVTCTGDF